MKKPIRHNQEGLASFIVVISLMLIISLIVLSFSRIVRNEQRQVLDRNLSARAFYAAESGVNTAVALIKQGNLVGDKTDCLGDPLKADDYAVDKNANTEVTCLTIDPDPETLKYTIAKGESRVIPLKGSAALGGLKFSWQDSNATASTN